MYGYRTADATQIDGTILRITNIRVPEPLDFDATEEVVFARKERKQYTAYLRERAKQKRKASTLGEEKQARRKAHRTA